MCAADARRDFEEVELAVRSAAYELRVRGAALHAERAQKLFVKARQLGVFGRIVIECVRREDAALVRDAHGRPPVAARATEDDSAAFDDGVNVEDFARDELFQKVVRRPVLKRRARVQLFDGAPNVLGLRALPYPRRRHVRARLDDPRRLDALHVLAYLLIVEEGHEVGHTQGCFARANAHRELVSEEARA